MIPDAKHLPERVRKEEKRAKRHTLLKKAAAITSALVLASATTYYAGKIFAGSNSAVQQVVKTYTNDDIDLISARYEAQRQAPGKSIDSIVTEPITKSGNNTDLQDRKSKQSEYGFLEKSVDDKINNWKNTVTTSTEKFTWTLFDSLKERLSETSALRDYISQRANENNLDHNLFYALTAWEGGENIKSVSSMGAAGPWMIMPKTGKQRGLIMNKFIDERFDLEKASLVGTEHLLDAISRYGNNTMLILADYNCGGTTLNRAIKKNGIKFPEKGALPIIDEKTLSRIYQDLPDETQEYILRLLATKKLLDEGIKFQIKDSLKQIIDNSTTHTVKKGESIYSIARNYNMRVEDIKEKNPQIINYKLIKKDMKIRI